MLKRVVVIAAALGLFSALPVTISAATAAPVIESVTVAQVSLPALYSTESEAQARCPKDVVVWLNIPSGIYHYKGERWYGRTKHGAYACEKEAIKAGDRASLNGQ